MLKKVLLAIVALVVVFLVIVAMQSSEFHVERSATIGAPAADVFAQVNDFHAWQAWSPWAKLDPAAKDTYEGPAAGTGAIFKWSGNNDVGEGAMTITESHPSDLIKLQLEFVRPYAGSSTVGFRFKADGDKTVVTWAMSGHKNFMAKAFGLFMSMDKMVGGQFEQGLSQLKTVVESRKDKIPDAERKEKAS